MEATRQRRNEGRGRGETICRVKEGKGGKGKERRLEIPRGKETSLTAVGCSTHLRTLLPYL